MRSEWTTWRPPYPSCTRILSKPIDYRLRPDPARRAVKTHDSEWGPRARQAGHRPTSGAPAKGPLGAEGAPLGAHESTQGTLQTLRLGPASQSDAAAARHMGAGSGRREYRECAGDPRGLVPTHGHPGAETTSPCISQYDSDSTPKAYRLGLETTTRPVGRFRSTPTGTTHCKEQQLGRVQDPGGAYSTPRLLLLGDTPAREVPSWIRH